MVKLNLRSSLTSIFFIYLFFCPAISFSGGALDSLNGLTRQTLQQADYYNQRADSLQTVADTFFAKAGRCKCTCDGYFHVHFFDGCGDYENMNRCVGMMYLRKSEEYRQQAQYFTSLSKQSCEESNQISSGQNNCNLMTTKSNTKTNAETCLGAGCKKQTTTTTSSARVYGSSGPSGMAAAATGPSANKGKDQTTKHKAIVLPDGNLQLENGKTIKLDEVKDANSLIASGLSPAFAQAIMGAKNTTDNVEKKLIEDLKKQGNDIASNTPNNITPSSPKLDLYSDYSEQTPSNPDKNPPKIDLYSDYSEETPSREPAYDVEGDRPTLSVKYFGEHIGASRENLFRMIKKRYRIKNRNDSFY